MFFPPGALDIPNPSSEKNKIVVKRFVFDASAIADLKAKYSNDNKNIGNPHPSRVEALSTFIWSRFHATT